MTATNQPSDVRFFAQRGEDELDADLEAVHGITSADIIAAGVASRNGTYATTIGLSNGADDTSWLNALIAPGGQYRGVRGQTYRISSPLIIPSNTHLDLTGCTVLLNAGSNCNWAKNKGVTAAATGTGSMTSGSNVVTTAVTAAVGQTVTVAGALAGGFVLVGKVSAVGSGTLTLVDLRGNALNAGATVSGAAVNVYTRDSNIRITGGTWDRGTNVGTGTDAHGLFFRHVDGLHIHPEKVVATSGGKYAVAPGDCTHVRVGHYEANVLSAAFQANGPIYDIEVADIWGSSGDDFVAFTPNDYPTYADVIGDITEVRVRDIEPSSCLSAVKAGGSTATAFTDVVVENVGGTTSASSQGVIWFGDDTAYPATTGCYYDRITVKHITSTPPPGVPRIKLDGSNMHSFELDGMNLDDAAATVAAVVINPGSAQSYDTLTFKNFTLRNWPLQPLINVTANATVTDLRVAGVRCKAPATPSRLVYVVGAVGNLVLDDVYLASTNATTQGVVVNGTLNDVTFSRFRTDFTVGNSNYLLQLNSANSTAVCHRASFVGCHTTGGGGLVQATLSTHTIDFIDVAALEANSTAWLCDLGCNATVDVHIAATTQVNAQSGSFSVRASGNVSVRCDASNISSGVTVAAGGNLYSRSTGFKVDVAKLTLNANDMAWNTNSATAPGQGPVVCDGTVWRPMKRPNGTAVLVAGTKAVADTKITASSKVVVSNIGAGGTVGSLSVALNAGVGFTINSTSGADTSTIYYEVVSY